MSLKVGIVGLPNVGKSTLFNALVSQHKAGVGQHPFTTIDKNIGMSTVPDDTVFNLAKIENIGKVTPAHITFVDIAGLIKGAHQGEGLGNQFLHHIREVDLILHVVRFFSDEKVSHVHTNVDPEEDLAVVEEELLLSDLASLEKRLKRENLESDEKELIKKLMDFLNKGTPARDIELSDKEKGLLIQLNLLSAKKQVVVANIGEDQLKNPPTRVGGHPTLLICAKLEAELNDLPWTESQRFLKMYGLAHAAKEMVILTCYKALDILTFYTIAKRKEARAWTLKRGSHAAQAAAAIHTDFAKHFVKAEVVNADELLKLGSWHKAHEAGKVALKGRDYVVQDRDVIEFKVAV